MNCNIIKDLMPLYIDQCCSKESEKAVTEHLTECKDCKALYEDMKSSDIPAVIYTPKKEIHKTDIRKASVIQSALLLISFALITVGVALEARIPSGFLNGYTAIALVAPVTGFMLSLVNWYFIRLYKSRKSFYALSALLTLIMTLFADAFTFIHYEIHADLFNSYSLKDILEILLHPVHPFLANIIITVILCLVSKVLSDRYAKYLGKE